MFASLDRRGAEMRNCISCMFLFAGTHFSVSAVAQVGILSPGVALSRSIRSPLFDKAGTRIEGHLTTPCVSR